MDAMLYVCSLEAADQESWEGKDWHFKLLSSVEICQTFRRVNDFFWKLVHLVQMGARGGKLRWGKLIPLTTKNIAAQIVEMIP